MPTQDTMPYWLATLDADALAALMTRRPDTLGIPPSSLVELAERLAAPQSIKLVVRELNRTRAEVLAAAQAVSAGRITVDTIAGRFRAGADRAAIERTLTELSDLGLLWPADGDTFELVTPLRRAGVQAGRLQELHVEPPEPRMRETGIDTVDGAAGAAVLPTVRGVTHLVELCSATPLDVLRSGGVGVKEIRRLAKALAADEIQVRLWLTLAYHADLLDTDDGEIMPTVAADTWLAGTPAERLVPLLMTWWALPAAPTAPDVHGKQQTALLHAYDDMDRQLRHDLLTWFADHEPGATLVDRDELLAVLEWWKPYVYGEPETACAILNEAASLGVVAAGGLSTWGRALVAGEEHELAAAVAKWLPATTGSVRLQADLTAVVTGIPTAELAWLLDLTADPGERDTASVWRFSPSSVRRALDAGHTADWLLTALADAAAHGVPQPLEYLVRDVARRHGELVVAEVGCCVLAEDPTLLAEVAAQRGLMSLAPRLLAPGVLASAKPAAETLDLLRAHGYGPVAVTSDGTPVLTRVAPQRAKPRARVMSRTPMRPKPTRPDPLEVWDLAAELLAAGVVETEAEESESVAAVRKYGDHLSNRELTLLTEAIEAETPVEITYLDQNDTGSKRVITPLELIGGMVAAWCHMRDDERHFLVSRIQRVDLPQRS
jgi:hypothetical protein